MKRVDCFAAWLHECAPDVTWDSEDGYWLHKAYNEGWDSALANNKKEAENVQATHSSPPPSAG